MNVMNMWMNAWMNAWIIGFMKKIEHENEI